MWRHKTRVDLPNDAVPEGNADETEESGRNFIPS
jgi:hypothetical protein